MIDCFRVQYIEEDDITQKRSHVTQIHLHELSVTHRRECTVYSVYKHPHSCIDTQHVLTPGYTDSHLCNVLTHTISGENICMPI